LPTLEQMTGGPTVEGERVIEGYLNRDQAESLGLELLAAATVVRDADAGP